MCSNILQAVLTQRQLGQKPKGPGQAKSVQNLDKQNLYESSNERMLEKKKKMEKQKKMNHFLLSNFLKTSFFFFLCIMRGFFLFFS